MKGNDGQYWGYSGRGMMHTKCARVKGLCKDHIVKVGPGVYNGAMKIAANQGHYNTDGEVGGGGISKGTTASDLNVR